MSETGLEFTFDDIIVRIKQVPITEEETEYNSILVSNIDKTITRIVLVSVSIYYTTSVEEPIEIIIPFYKPQSGIMSCAWFPFHCFSHQIRATDEEYYFISNPDQGEIFVQGHYVNEPFNQKNDNTSMSGRGCVGCSYQKKFFLNLLDGISSDKIYRDPDNGIGQFTALKRFGNFLYLFIVYNLLGLGQTINGENLKKESQDFLELLTGYQLVQENGHPRDLDLTNPLVLDDRIELNSVLYRNSVNLPHYAEVRRSENSPDAKFVLSQKILQSIGEMLLYRHQTEEIPQEAFQNTYFFVDRLFQIDIENYRMWTLYNMFSPKVPVILYR